MQPYRNIGGDSGVVGYESGADFIRVQFSPAEDGASQRSDRPGAGASGRLPST